MNGRGGGISLRAPATLVAFGLGAMVSACFDVPQPDVSFSCAADDPTPCPAGYACETDGCCHREGSDVDANRGACRLSSAFETGDGSETG